MRKPSVSTTFTVYFDGRFWVGVAERVEHGLISAAKVVFGAEPSDEEIFRFVLKRWNDLPFSPEIQFKRKEEARNPKRRQRKAAKEAAVAKPSTKAQQAVAEMREQSKAAAKRRNTCAKRQLDAARFALKRERRKQKRRGH